MAETSFGRPGGYHAVGIVVNVEDDPTQTGMVRVRWYEGAASQDRLADDDLPWTRCLFPVTNPSFRQTGGPHTGLRVGSIVYGTTVDGAGQEYMVIGSSPRAGTGRHDEELDFDSDIPQPAKIEENDGENQPRHGDVNSVVTQKSIVQYGQDEGGDFGAALFAELPDSIGLIDEAITA